MVSEYLERTAGSVSDKALLLAEALDVLRPLASGPSIDAAAVRLAAWIHGRRQDWANVADLCQRFLGQTSDWEDRAFAALEVVAALTLLERHEEAVAAHRAHIEEVMAERPGEEWADAMHNSTQGACWFVTGKRDAWVELFRKVDAGVEATPDDRASRYELLHTAVMAMGTDQATYGRDIDALVQRMADIIAEDPDWSERLCAEQRFEQQKVGNAVRSGDAEALTQAVDHYRTFLDGCTWPAELIATAYSNLGAILHWEGRHGSAVECFVRAQQEHELDGYGYAWFAGASSGAGAPRARVTELLAEAGRRLESADAMRIFNERPTAGPALRSAVRRIRLRPSPAVEHATSADGRCAPFGECCMKGRGAVGRRRQGRLAGRAPAAGLTAPEPIPRGTVWHGRGHDPANTAGRVARPRSRAVRGG